LKAPLADSTAFAAAAPAAEEAESDADMGLDLFGEVVVEILKNMN